MTTAQPPDSNMPTFNSNPNLVQHTSKDGSMHPIQPYQQLMPQYHQNNPLPVPLPQYNNQQSHCKKQLVNLAENTIKLKEVANRHADMLQVNNKKTFESIQMIAVISRCVNEELGILKERAAELKEFVVASEGAIDVDVKNVVMPADPVSKELLEYVSTKKALEEVILAI